MEEVKKRRGKIAKSPIPEGTERLTSAQIAQRYRERQKAAGLNIVSFWLPEKLIESIRDLAEKNRENTSETVERILSKHFKIKTQ